MRRLLSLLLLLPALADADESLRLAVGEQRALPAGKVQRLSVADPGVAEAVQVGEGERREILVTALKPGRTDLLLWEGEAPRTLRIEVSELDPGRFVDEIRELTKGIEGLVVRSVGDKVVLDGKLLAERDKQRVDLIAKAYPQVLNLTTVDLGRHHAVVVEEIRRRIPGSAVKLDVLDGKVLLRGTVATPADRTAAEQIALAFFPSVTNQLEVSAEMLEVDVTFTRVSLSDLRQAGQNLPASVTGLLTGQGASGTSPLYGVSAQVPLALAALRAKGKASVLSEPRLTTASGSEASFHNGGEKAIRVAGTGVADVKYKKYGLLLKVSPTLLSDGRIRTRIAIEVSAPDEGAGGEPGFTTFTTESELVSAPGEAVVVSGLVDSLKTKFREKTPVLGSIPILSAFFSATREAADETRLLVLVVPRRVAARPAP